MMHAHISTIGFKTRRTGGGGVLGSLKRGLALVAAFIVGALVLFAAGVIALATAIVGVVIAFVAMLIRFGAWNRSSGSAPAEASMNETGESVLEARRTARGWTVDN